MFKSKYNNINKGFFLTEILLGVMLSGLLLSFLYDIYIINRESERKQSLMMKMQTYATIVTNILTNEIKMAGYIGCAKLSKDFPLISDTSVSLSLASRLIGLPNDAFQIMHADISHASLLEPVEDNSTLIVNNVIHFKPGDILIISDCKAAEIFQVAACHTNEGRQQIVPINRLHYHFGQDAELARLQINKFYVAKTNRRHTDGSWVYALYLENIKGETEELVEEVEHMHILYYVKHNKKILSLPVTTVVDWSSLAGVAIDIEFNSPLIKKTWPIVVALND